MSELTTTKSDVSTIIDSVAKRIYEIGGEIRQPGGTLALCPHKNFFTPGLYIREIFMPAGSVVVSCVHKTEHPFVVSKGWCFVYNEKGEWVEIKAPYMGITKPGTRRFLVMREDTIWTTFHPTTLTDVAAIEAEIIEPYIDHIMEITR